MYKKINVFKILSFIVMPLLFQINAFSSDLNLKPNGVTIADGPLAIYWNPANLADENQLRVNFSYNEIFLITGYYFGATIPVFNGGQTFGLAFYHLQNSGNDYYNYYENTLLSSFSTKIIKNLSLGFAGKLYYASYSTYTYNSVDVNIGVNYFILKMLEASLVVENAFQSPIMQDWNMFNKGYSTRFYKPGIKYIIQNFKIFAEGEITASQYISITGGVLFEVLKNMNLLLALEDDYVDGLVYNFGVKYSANHFGFSFGDRIDTDLGSNYTASLEILY